MSNVVPFIIVCYFMDWNNQLDFQPQNIGSDMYIYIYKYFFNKIILLLLLYLLIIRCTHINYSFSKTLNSDFSNMFECLNNLNYLQLIELKNQNTNLKILFSIGGKLKFNIIKILF
jgi:GH18 family chitinase